jgi:hypothetical protein
VRRPKLTSPTRTKESFPRYALGDDVRKQIWERRWRSGSKGMGMGGYCKIAARGNVDAGLRCVDSGRELDGSVGRGWQRRVLQDVAL